MSFEFRLAGKYLLTFIASVSWMFISFNMLLDMVIVQSTVCE